VHARAARMPLYAAGLTAILAAALTACGSVSGGSSAAPITPLTAVRLAADTSNTATSFTGTLSVQAAVKAGTAGSGGTTFTATFTERLRPSLLAQVDVQSMTAGGTTVPGGMTEILTPGTLYMKWSYLTQMLKTTKPWLSIPLSVMSKGSGINFGQMLDQASSSSPLTESQLLAGATAVRKVGTGTVGGVPVTKYTGTLSLAKGLKYLSASVRSAMQKEIGTAGITHAAFTVWIDGKNTVRKAIITENGTALTETITTTITSINQPVNISIPAASQTTQIPTGSLSNLG
jgi:outer membrane protein W